MLRFISVSILMLLLCSCVQQKQPGLTAAERVAQAQEQRTLWDKKFGQLPGTHVSGLIQAWGEPEKLGNNEYLWSSRREIRGGGYYVTETYSTTSRVYETGATGVSRLVGHIVTPMKRERYVPPYTREGNWVEIRVTTNRNGIITHASVDGSGSIPAVHRATDFPFPKE